MRRFWTFPALVLALIPCAGGDEPARTFRVVTPKSIDIEATGLNRRGDLIGFEWIEEKEKDKAGVVGQKPFFARGKEMTYLPLLKGYTSTSPAAVSDDGLVVGHASKPMPPGTRVEQPNQAFVWDARAGIRGLGVLSGDAASLASGISRDGRRISGFSVGPNRIRACVWDRRGDGWEGTALPHATRLVSHTVAISGDGKIVAATDGALPCLWTQDSAGLWTREMIADEPGILVPRAVNDAGMVVGLRFGGDGLEHAVVWTRAEGCRRLKEPEGYVRSEAKAVNNLGVVVGMIDGPHGGKIGPNAFVYDRGKLRVLDEGGPLFAAATAINDRGEVAGVLEERED